MAPKFGDKTRGVLEYRPDIVYIEPEVQSVAPTPVVQEPSLQDYANKTKSLAKAVNVLALAIQTKADLKAKNMVIKLDPKVDAAAVQAMKRMYPEANPYEITYEQYRKCKEGLINRGLAVAKQGLVSQDDIAKRKEDELGGYGTEAARTGGLRPELNTRAQIIPPLDIDEFQDVMIKILVNFIWKNFIRPVFKPIGIPGLGSIADALPKQLRKLPKGFKVGDLISIGVPLLGEKKEKKSQPAIPEGV